VEPAALEAAMAPAAVLLCAIELLGPSGRTLPRIELVPEPPANVSPDAEGFVRHSEPVIYIVTSAPAFRGADCFEPDSLVKLASVIVHEAWHVRHGADEKGAYEAQLYAILQLGLPPESSQFRSVQQAMKVALREQQTRRTAPGPDAAARR
jgi:hypothetical protein